jgi:CelD/BcsL family acetyltransferase involved in cellulose biosynthesis
LSTGLPCWLLALLKFTAVSLRGIMQIEIIRTSADLEALKDEWNELLIQGASHVPFLRHEYLSTWWQTLGGGEWEHGELYVVTGRERSVLCGVAPLFFTHNREGEPALMLLGSIEISDYLDVIARPEHLSPFLNALLEHLSSPQAPSWRLLDWYNILEDSHTLPALNAAAEGMGWSYQQEPLQHCPYIPLPDEWEVYLEGLDKKQRHEIRRKMRRAEELYPPVRWYIVEDEDSLDEGIDGLLHLMSLDPEKDKFLTEVMRSQMRSAVHSAFQSGWLQLSFLKIGDENAAGYLNFDYGEHIWVYNSGLNFAHGKLSPGWVLLAYLIQWAIDHKRKAFDFMRGDEDYKYRFGAVDRRVMRTIVRR